ncbi:MAG TPA: ABC transporter permease [Gemmatimonadaceae bacterium]|nr:ABC transporter permease [Gemmatimonadaceae bacterium]
MTTTAHDVRLAVRHLRRAPLFTVGVVLSFALGIGATVTLFSVVQGVLLRPLPFREAERLIVVQRAADAGGGSPTALTGAEVAALREARQTINALGAYAHSEFVVSGDLGAERVIGARVTADLIDVLGARPALGRSFRPGEDGQVAAPVVLLSHGLWSRRYGADAAIVGRSIRLDGQPHTVIGVLGEHFEFPGGMAGRGTDLWTPLAIDVSSMQGRNRRSLTAIARLRPGSTPANAATELGRLMPGTPGVVRVDAAPIAQHMIGTVRSSLVAIFASVMLLLAIVCANTSSLMLSRATQRRRSVSLRLALGAQRWDIVRPTIIEAVVLGVAGGMLGLLVSVSTRGIVLRLIPATLPRHDAIRVDVWVVLFAALLSVLIGVACGLIPALRMASASALGALVETGRASVGAGGRGVQRMLVVSQIGLGALLLTATGAMVVGYSRVSRIAPGFEPANAVTMSVSTSGMRYRSPAAKSALIDALLSRARALPGVRAAATTNILPLGGGIMSAAYQVVGVTDTDSTALRSAPVRSVSGGFFATLGIPLVRGRAIDDRDVAGALRVAVVNEAFARQLDGTDAIGAQLRVSSPMVDSGTITIVGVAADTRERGLTGSAVPMVYVSLRQSPFPYNNFVIRTTGTAGSIAAALRAELRRLDADLAIDEVGRLSDRVGAAYAMQSFGLTTLSVFALLAIALVALGVFALVAGHVAAQQKSIGIRMALGATPRLVQWRVLAETLALASLGVAAGTLLSFALRDPIAAVTRDPSALGPGIAAAAGGVLAAVVLLAGWIPARRASRTDPRVVLSAD